MSHEGSSPAAANQQPEWPEGYISAHMDLVMAEAAAMPNDKERAALVADHFIGATLRTQGRVPGFNTVRYVSRFHGDPMVADGQGESGPWDEFLTRGGGLRRAASAIESSVPEAFHGLDHRLRIGDDGMPLLVTMDQITAVVDTQSDAERNLRPEDSMQSWQSVIKSGIKSYLDAPQGTGSVWGLINNPEPGIGPVRQAQNEWQVAARIADSAGVDVGLLTQSAEFMKTHIDDPMQREAINPSVSTPIVRGYDHLFE